uniref:Uncharacterized protein n=1 Tax=Phytophthora fragariae TaxID=53985 RepID=A0A6A3EGI9_9STRA|nr:hypothetical protein PF009_g18600 [Phytophthora fragariae]
MVDAELLDPVVVFLVEDDDLVEPVELPVEVVLLTDPEAELEVPSPVLDELDEPLLTTTPTITPTMASTTITPMAISPFLGIAIFCSSIRTTLRERSEVLVRAANSRVGLVFAAKLPV